VGLRRGPPAIALDPLNDALQRAIEDPAFRSRLAELGAERRLADIPSVSGRMSALGHAPIAHSSRDARERFSVKSLLVLLTPAAASLSAPSLNPLRTAKLGILVDEYDGQVGMSRSQCSLVLGS
jgi:hypothetical protein